MATLGDLTRALNLERQQKYSAGLGNLKDILKLFGPGFGKEMERTALAGVEEDLISRGLGSTTRPVAASVGMKSDIEGFRRGKLAEALAMISQYTQQSAPTAPLISQTAQASNLALRQPGQLSPFMQNLNQSRGLTGSSQIGGFNTISSRISRPNPYLLPTHSVGAGYRRL